MFSNTLFFTLIHIDIYVYVSFLFDFLLFSRIGFYVSCFQSIFTLQEVFHRDAALVRNFLFYLVSPIFLSVCYDFDSSNI